MNDVKHCPDCLRYANHNFRESLENIHGTETAVAVPQDVTLLKLIAPAFWILGVVRLE